MKRVIWICLTLSILCGVNALAQQTVLFSMPTAETLGKGGYVTQMEVFRYEYNDRASAEDVVVGDFFKEQHSVVLKADKLVFPVTLIFGVGDNLDLMIGSTVTSGSMDKSITDYYETGDTTRERVYSQPMFDGRFGLKYNVKPEMGDGMPAIAIGGELHSGYTADDHLDSGDSFRDDTPADGFPFAAARLYIAATQKVTPLIAVHGNAGGYLSQKRFRFSAQLGADLEMTEALYAAATYSTVRLVSGSEFNSRFDFGLRLRVASGKLFYVALNSADFGDLGFAFGFTVSGEKVPLATPVGAPPSNVEDLF